MPSSPTFQHAPELEPAHQGGRPTGVAGKVPVTARLAPKPVNQMIFRVDSPEVARALGAAFGPRDGNGVAAGADVVVDRAAASASQPLPAAIQRRFESSLGADLSSVRVHTGAESADAAGAVGAKAYATGQDIHFAAGAYQPDDPFGMHLLAHEVAHTVQQRGGPATRQHKLDVSSPSDSAEVEADRAADAMVAGAPFAVGAGSAALARAPDGADHARAASEDKKEASVEATPTSLKVGAKGVSGSIDWSKGVEGKLAYKVEQDVYKLPDVVQQFKIASYKEVAGLLGAIKVGGGLKYGGELVATGSYQSGKGGSVTLTGTGFAEASLSGTATVAGYVGIVGKANMNAGVVGKITETARAAVVTTAPVYKLAADGKASGTVQIEGDVTVEQNVSWGMEVGWYFNGKTGTMAALELGSKPLGKLSNIGFSLGINADGSVTGPTLKWPPVYTPPPPLQLTEGAHRAPTAEEKAHFKQDDARQAGERDGGSGSGAGVPPEAYEDDPAPVVSDEPETCDPDAATCEDAGPRAE